MSPRVQKLVQEAADLSPAERLTLIQELVGSIDVNQAQMDRQRRAVLEFLSISPEPSGDPTLSSSTHGIAGVRREG